VTGGSVLWAETPDDDAEEQPAEPIAEGEVDDTFAARRLRRWLKGMFGGAAKPAAEPEDGPGREPEP
jgi:hypothetical protein